LCVHTAPQNVHICVCVWACMCVCVCVHVCVCACKYKCTFNLIHMNLHSYRLNNTLTEKPDFGSHSFVDTLNNYTKHLLLFTGICLIDWLVTPSEFQFYKQKYHILYTIKTKLMHKRFRECWNIKQNNPNLKYNYF